MFWHSDIVINQYIAVSPKTILLPMARPEKHTKKISMSKHIGTHQITYDTCQVACPFKLLDFFEFDASGILVRQAKSRQGHLFLLLE